MSRAGVPAQGRPGRARRLAIFYIVCWAFFLGAQLLLGLRDEWYYRRGRLQDRELTLADFALTGAEPTGPLSLVTATEDAQMLYAPAGQEIRSLTVRCTFSADPGEVVLFYRTDPSRDFGTDQMLKGTEENGAYTFVLPRGVRKVRLDPGAAPSLTVTFSELRVNAYSHAACFRFQPAEFYWLFWVPGVLWGLGDTAVAGVRWLRRRAAAAKNGGAT